MELSTIDLVDGQEIYICSYFFTDPLNSKAQRIIEPSKIVINKDGYNIYFIYNKKTYNLYNFRPGEYNIYTTLGEAKTQYFKLMDKVVNAKHYAYDKILEFKRKQEYKYKLD